VFDATVAVERVDYLEMFRQVVKRLLLAVRKPF
jgi:hypothetical protein